MQKLCILVVYNMPYVDKARKSIYLEKCFLSRTHCELFLEERKHFFSVWVQVRVNSVSLKILADKNSSIVPFKKLLKTVCLLFPTAGRFYLVAGISSLYGNKVWTLQMNTEEYFKDFFSFFLVSYMYKQKKAHTLFYCHSDHNV